MLESKPPIAFSSAGKVYRKDDDAMHLPMFHQVDVNLGLLRIDTLNNPLRQL